MSNRPAVIRPAKKRRFLMTLTVWLARQPSRSAKSSSSFVSASLQIIAGQACQKCHSPESLRRSGVMRWEDKPETRGRSPRMGGCGFGCRLGNRLEVVGLVWLAGRFRSNIEGRAFRDRACMVPRRLFMMSGFFRNLRVAATGRGGAGSNGNVAVSAKRWNVANGRTRLGTVPTKCLRQAGV